MRWCETLPRLDGLPVTPGALPPAFILDAARAALAQGRDGRWHAPFAFVDAEQAQVVGSGGSKGAPVAGRVELGYGVAEQAQGRGVRDCGRGRINPAGAG